MDSGAVQNKLKTLTQGEYSDAVLQKMAATFTTLCALADFTETSKPPQPTPEAPHETVEPPLNETPNGGSINLGGLVYNIQLILPESRDPKVYDALFQSLRKHLR